MFTLNDNLLELGGMLGGNIVTFSQCWHSNSVVQKHRYPFFVNPDLQVELVQWNANVGGQIIKVRETVITLGLGTLRKFRSSVASIFHLCYWQLKTL